MAAAQTQCGDEWDGAQQSAEEKQLSEGQRKFSGSDNNIFVTLTWNKTKERWRKVQETGDKSLNKGRFMWRWSSAQSTWHKRPQTQLTKNILQPHKIVSNTTKHLEPAVLKQQESNNSYNNTRTCRHYLTGTPQQVITASHTTSRLLMGLHLHCPQKGQTSHLTRTWRDG